MTRTFTVTATPRDPEAGLLPVTRTLTITYYAGDKYRIYLNPNGATDAGGKGYSSATVEVLGGTPLDLRLCRDLFPGYPGYMQTGWQTSQSGAAGSGQFRLTSDRADATVALSGKTAEVTDLAPGRYEAVLIGWVAGYGTAELARAAVTLSGGETTLLTLEAAAVKGKTVTVAAKNAAGADVSADYTWYDGNTAHRKKLAAGKTYRFLEGPPCTCRLSPPGMTARTITSPLWWQRISRCPWRPTRSL